MSVVWENMQLVQRSIWRLGLILVALTGLCLVGAVGAKASEPVAEIPYRYDYNGWITVPVMVNGQGPYDFIVDTGATLSVVFQNLADQQEFPSVEGENRRVLGLIEASELPPRYIGRIESGGVALDNLTSVVIEDWLFPRATPQGVLGLDFLSRYVVQVDPGSSTIKLYSDGAPDIVNERRWSDVRLRARFFADGQRPLYVVRARVRRSYYPFILDLGASGTIVNYEALLGMLQSRRINMGSTAVRSRLPKVQDLFGNERTARLVRVQRIRIGGVTLRNRIISVYDAEVFDELGVGDQPYGLFGADLLRGRSFVMDFPEQRLHIGPEVSRRQERAADNDSAESPATN